MMDPLMYRTWRSTGFFLSAKARHQEVKEEAVNDQHENYNHLAAMALNKIKPTISSSQI